MLPVGNILEVYAQDHSTGKKTKALVKDQKAIESLRNRALLDHGQRLHKRIDRYLNATVNLNTSEGTSEPDPSSDASTDIKRYGLTRLMLDELYTATQRFQSALKLREDVMTYRKKILSKRDNLVKANRKLLDKRLNKLMTVFTGTHPSFYKEYENIVTPS
jgi:hypothetical protein